MRFPWSKRREAHVDPRLPHPFQDIEDAGLGTGLSGMSSRGSAVNQVAMTNRYLRTSGCGVPGCGRERGDPVHAAADEPG